ncbi:beta-lactamase [Salmonella enterica subsp. enterica serovar Paratyphi A]|nr:beta-lactamase [Salmonella enterica subsp. enterica serovar Paratyphi A]
MTFLGITRKIKKLSCEVDYSRYRMMYTRDPLPIGENFIWSGEIAVVAPEAYGIFGGHDAEPDSILDEGVLIYQSAKGLVIITGCGHRGIANIVRHCQNITGIKRIYALVGGFHLRCAHRSRCGESGAFCKNKNLKNYAVVTVQGPGGGCGYRK